MTLDELNAFCAGLPHATHVVQWRGADVWKVGGKVFAICREPGEGGAARVTFKVTEIAYEVLSEMPGLRPAPHLASRGMLWIQRHGLPGLDDGDLRFHIARSHELVVAGLTKKKRRELGL